MKYRNPFLLFSCTILTAWGVFAAAQDAGSEPRRPRDACRHAPTREQVEDAAHEFDRATRRLVEPLEELARIAQADARTSPPAPRAIEVPGGNGRRMSMRELRLQARLRETGHAIEEFRREHRYEPEVTASDLAAAERTLFETPSVESESTIPHGIDPPPATFTSLSEAAEDILRFTQATRRYSLSESAAQGFPTRQDSRSLFRLRTLMNRAQRGVMTIQAELPGFADLERPFMTEIIDALYPYRNYTYRLAIAPRCLPDDRLPSE